MKSLLKERIEKELLPFVIKPGRYVGNELNVIKKEHSGRVKVALGFPDLYEIGMSYLGLAILYHIVNSREDSLAERFFVPDLDAEKRLRELGIPLFSLESWTALSDFDILGFSLTHELNFTNVLNILDLSGIPVLSRERNEECPLVIAGGPSCSNPEPMAEFMDAFVIGDGEEVIHEILDRCKDWKLRRSKKEETLAELSTISGVYVPSLYEARYDQKGKFESLVTKLEGTPKSILKRNLKDLENQNYPTAPLVPLVEITHDRLDLEIMRGCAWRCAFCHACQFYAPLRTRKAEDILSLAREGIASSGWEEISLLSLSTTDYPGLDELVAGLNKGFIDKRVSIALPSMRPGSFTQNLAQEILKVKKTGLTFAPEAGTARLRKLINKNIDEEELLQSVRIAYASGWNLLKLYFMLGLPTEEEMDLEGIVGMIDRSLQMGRKVGSGGNLNVTISPFLPKPHTPFQRERQADIQEMESKTSFLKSRLKRKNLNLKFRNPRVSYLEGILGRGDRRMSGVILSAWKNGARFDAWKEHFKFDIWQESLKQTQLKAESYLARIDECSPLPWEHISLGEEPRSVERGREEPFLLVEKKEGQAERDLPLLVNQTGSYGRSRKKTQLIPRSTVARSKVRIKWAKDERARFSSHLDVIRMFERAIRRSNIPIGFSEGFHPHPKISFGPPLPLGFISETEYLDLQLAEPYSSAVFFDLNRSLHPGFLLLEAKPILERTPSLSLCINLVVYETVLEQPKDLAQAKTEELLRRDTLMVIRKTQDTQKGVEARYFIKDLECQALESKTKLILTLMLGAKGYIRPQEVLSFGLGLDEKQIAGLIIKRTRLLITKDDRVLSPFDMI